MSRWRIALVLVLISVPIFVWAAVGSYYLWSIGWGFWAWWPLMAMVMLGYGLAWYWQSKKQLLRPPDFEVPVQWTDRDRQALQIVQRHAEAGEKLSLESMGDASLYLKTAQDLARDLAAFYHPGATDPTDYLTVPELLSVVELASHDLRKLVDEHLPGGHLLTVQDWKRARMVQDWYQRGSNLWWTLSAIFNPLQTGLRYMAAQAGIGTPMRMLQQNLLRWFYTAFVQRMGHYLIELNSGRLRVGADRYRELVDQLAKQQKVSVLEKQAAGPFAPGTDGSSDASDQIQQITITVMGQTKVGKSSLINALLGEQRARTGVTPSTMGIDRYELMTPGIPTRLILNDTVGYGHQGPRADQVSQTAELARQSDLLFLVLHARNPGRQADLSLLDQLKAWFTARPEVKVPPVIAVITHVDLLSPMMEWNPPYDWVGGTRPKENSIREAVVTVREQLGERLVSVVPVCTSPGKEYGIEDALLPAVANWLDELQGVALLRALKAEADRDRMVRVFRQLMASGKFAAERLWDAAGS
ncbi:MAG: GTPase [Gemmataceae bacterium]